ncbi:hypothetical protein HJC23_010545 [Cyclotella cryptica]|uniref:Protein kinase domain-containing protein n=1 Tax=Cyclotella cryptica TaxID=29204 RepID=A0ABD3QBK2_9STRA
MEMSSQGGCDAGKVEEVRRLFREIHQISISKGKLSFKDYHKLPSRGSVRLAPDDDQFSDDESESKCTNGKDDEFLMHEPSKLHDAQQNSREQASPETVNEGSCTLETPRDGSSIAPRHIVLDARFHQDFTYQDLGKGSYGMVEECKHKLDMQRYAIKQITPKEGKSSLTLAKYEVYVLAQLSSLNDLRVKHKNLTNNQKIDCFTQITSALVLIHEHDISHLDIKPDNIFVVRNSAKSADQLTFKLGDFGISKSYVEESTNGLFYRAPDDDRFSDDESESKCTNGKDDEFLMHEPSKLHDAQQNSREQASPETINEGSCTLETPRDGSSIAPHHIFVDSRFHQDFTYQDLGKGSYGMVEECKHKLDMQRYAIKQITPKEGKSSLTLAKYEIDVLAQLSSLNDLRVKHIKIDCFTQITSALVLIHEHDISHLDIKPDNIFVIRNSAKSADQLTFKLGDFGISVRSGDKVFQQGDSRYAYANTFLFTKNELLDTKKKSYVKESTNGLFYRAPDDDRFSDDESESTCTNGKDNEFLMHEPSKLHDAQQNSREQASPETINEGSCTLETPRDGSSIAPHHIVVDSRFHQDFTYQDLGKGSYGMVEECKHKLDMQRYAIKQITPKEGKSSLTLAKYEVYMLAQLSSLNDLRVKHIKIDCFTQITSALVLIHEHDISHLDIKPDNIFVVRNSAKSADQLTFKLDDDQFSDDESESKCTNGKDDEFLMHEPSKLHDAQQNSREQASPETINEGSCTLETPRDGSSIAPHHIFVDSRFHQDFTYQDLGKGSYGMVEECKHKLDMQRYAIKQITPKEGKSSLTLAKYEVYVLAQLSSLNDLRVKHIKIDCFTQITSALVLIHEHDISHLDIKPDNIFVVRNSAKSADQLTFKLGDFGIAVRSGDKVFQQGDSRYADANTFLFTKNELLDTKKKSYVEESTNGLFYRAPDDDQFSVDESESACTNGKDNEFLMHEPSKLHDAQQNSREQASPKTINEGSCTLETPRDGSSIAPRHIVVDSRFHQDFTYQDLGKGSYGMVEECKHKLDMQRYAIKQITPKEGKSSLILAKYEVYVLAQLSSLNDLRVKHILGRRVMWNGLFYRAPDDDQFSDNKIGSKSYVEESTNGLFYRSPDDNQFSDDESKSECTNGKDNEFLMHEPSKVHDAQQNSREQASPKTINEGSCTLETPRDGSSIAPRHIFVDSRFHQDFTYQDLGKGSYGMVEEYKHKLDMQRYAIKQITPKEGKSSLTLAKYEVYVLAQLSSLNDLRVKHIKIDCFTQITSALVLIHEHDISHLDIKPDNIFVVRNSAKSADQLTFKLGDFGIAVRSGDKVFQQGDSRYADANTFLFTKNELLDTKRVNAWFPFIAF